MKLTKTQEKVSIHINKLIATKVVEQLKKLAPEKLINKKQITERSICISIDHKYLTFGVYINFKYEYINFVCGTISLTEPTIFKNIANIMIYCFMNIHLHDLSALCETCPSKYFKGDY